MLFRSISEKKARKLKPEQLKYSATDVVHLHKINDELNKILFRENRIDLYKEALELTSKGKGRQFIAGALGGGLAEGVFVGDVKDIGSFGDLLGGPTEIDRSADPNAAAEILNRVKFGTEGALFTGILGGTGKVIKKLANRNKQLDVLDLIPSKKEIYIEVKTGTEIIEPQIGRASCRERV